MLKRVGCGKQGKQPRLFIPSKTATFVPKFAVEDLPLHRTTTLVPAFAMKDPDDDRFNSLIYLFVHLFTYLINLFIFF